MKYSYAFALNVVAVGALVLSGCNQNSENAKTSSVAKAAKEGEPEHGGWWCYEHGVPEEQCAMCDSKLAKQLREKGDWCEEHNRPESLCFKCNPEFAQKFAQLYEAKYGKAPPQPTD